MPKQDKSPEPGPQMDPMLDTEGPASPVRTWSVVLGMTFVVALVLYGLSHPRSGANAPENTASIPSAAPATSAGPSAAPSGQNQQGQQNQQAQSQPNSNTPPQTTGSGAGNNAPSNPPKAQERVNQTPANPPRPEQQPPANAGSQGDQTR